jgi:flagellar basal-body rod protein FlgG
MSSVLSLAAIGMTNDLYQLDVIGHNFANVQTPGFKQDIAVAREFNAYLDGAAHVESGMAYAMDGPMLTTVVNRSAGGLKNTGNPLDFALEGEGFFEVLTPEGVGYTRDGSFRQNAEGQLVTSLGYVVSGIAGDIRLAHGNPRVDDTGRIWDADNLLGQLKVVRFHDQTRLTRAGSGLYRGDEAIPVEPQAELRIRQGYLENSNVQWAQEMIRLIATVRHFEATQRVVRGADEMLADAVETIARF